MKNVKYLFPIFFILAAMLLPGAISCGDDDDDDDDDGGSPDSYIGTWKIVGTLVTSSAEDVPGNNNIEPGYQREDTWVIEGDGNELILTGTNGLAIPGEVKNGVAVFDETWEDAQSWPGYIIYVTVHIELTQGGVGITGTEDLNYSAYVQLTGTTTPLGMEAWEIDGVQK